MKKVSRHQDIADHFGVTIHAVGKWVSRGMPGSPGDYDLGAIDDWRAATMRPRIPQAESMEDLARYIRAKADFTEASATNAAFALVGQSQIVDLDSVSGFLTSFLDEAKKQLAKMAHPAVAKKYGSRASFYSKDIAHRHKIVLQQMRGWLLQVDRLRVTELRK